MSATLNIGMTALGPLGSWSWEIMFLRPPALPWITMSVSVEAPSLWRLATPAVLFLVSLVGNIRAARLVNPVWCGRRH
jgi:hypothetical protein